VTQNLSFAAHLRKAEVKAAISNIYHEHGGVDGYRTMQVYLARQGYNLSQLTVHKYMNVELQLFSISRKRKPAYASGTPHKVFENKLNQDFTSAKINRKWCTDFTYLFLTDGCKRWNHAKHE
jgi:transposase InsO family protein